MAGQRAVNQLLRRNVCKVDAGNRQVGMAQLLLDHIHGYSLLRQFGIFKIKLDKGFRVLRNKGHRGQNNPRTVSSRSVREPNPSETTATISVWNESARYCSRASAASSAIPCRDSSAM